MYLTEQAVLETLKLVSTLTSGSAIAFDYFAREFVDAEPPFVKLSKSMKKSIRFYDEELIYGITTSKPARSAAEKVVTDCGLQLVKFEHSNEEKPPKAPLYCFVLAVNKED